MLPRIEGPGLFLFGLAWLAPNGRADASRGLSLCGQCRDIFFRRDAADIDAQTKRRPRVAGVKHVGVTLRLLGADAVDPPLRVGKPCLGVAGDGGQQVIPAPQKVAQHRVDQTLRGSALDPGGRAYRAVDDRVRRRLRVNELVERNPEKRLDARVCERPVGEKPHDGPHLTEKAQCAVRELAHESAISNVPIVLAGKHRGKRRSRKHPSYRLRRDALRSLHRGGLGSPRKTSERHCQQAVDTLLGGRMGAEKTGDTASRERIDDHHVRRRRVSFRGLER